MKKLFFLFTMVVFLMPTMNAQSIKNEVIDATTSEQVVKILKDDKEANLVLLAVESLEDILEFEDFQLAALTAIANYYKEPEEIDEIGLKTISLLEDVLKRLEKIESPLDERLKENKN